MVDRVNHPSHYTYGKIETIDYIDSVCGLDRGYYIGNIIKYISRYQHKGTPTEDLQKAEFYLKRLIQLESGEIDMVNNSNNVQEVLSILDDFIEDIKIKYNNHVIILELENLVNQIRKEFDCERRKPKNE